MEERGTRARGLHQGHKHTQYSIILSGPNSARSAEKAFKLKTKVKAKAKAKPKIFGSLGHRLKPLQFSQTRLVLVRRGSITVRRTTFAAATTRSAPFGQMSDDAEPLTSRTEY